ncbi:MAG TPA: type II CAAX endopeptidase family protein, partial [Anaerovoracaceae bacterium]|nr:type II CAAX endopeptidase family protein [Anaerovoracaceae bacterium]
AALFANIIASYGSVLIVAVLVNKFSLNAIGFRKTGWLWVRRAIFWGLGLMVIRAFLAQGLLYLFPFLNFGTEMLQQSLVTNNLTLSSQIIVIVLGALVIPVGEELFFRGFLYRWIRNRLSFSMAVLMSALVFGAFHLIPIQAIMAFPLGLLNAWMFERSRSLWPPIVLHITNNLFTLVIAFAVLTNQ